jgi:hypothetical protein
LSIFFGRLRRFSIVNRRVVFPTVARWQAHIGYYFQRLPDAKHTSGIISSDYPMPSTHRAVVPSNARQQACIGSCFKRLLGNKHASGHVFSDYPKNVAVGCENAFLSTVVGTFHDPSGSISYPQGHFGHFFVHYSWVSIARGIEPEMPLIARRSDHFDTRRLISIPVGSFRYPSAHFVTHRGISVFFPSITPGMCLHLASKPKCPAHAVWSCPANAKAAGMAGLGLARRETTPPYICILGFSPCGRKKHLFVRGAY